MSKIFKKLLLAALIILVAGVVVWTIGMSVIDWDYKRLDSNEYTQKSYVAESKVQKIEVDVDSFPLNVVCGDSVSLEYYESDNSTVTVECEDGVLRVNEDYDYNPFKSGLFDFGRSLHKYVLTITEGVELNLDVTTSDIVLDGVSFEHLTVKSVNCDLSFTNCKIGEMSFKSTNSDVSFNDCEFDSVKIDAVNIDLTVKNSTANVFIVESVNTTAKLVGSELGAFKLHSTNITFNASGGNVGEMSVDGVNTTCTINKIAVDTLYVKSTNLTARLNILGKASEYSVVTHGKNMPGERQGSTDKSVTLRGTNNTVTLEFSE